METDTEAEVVAMQATPTGTIITLEATQEPLMELMTIQVPTPTGMKTLGLEVEVNVLPFFVSHHMFGDARICLIYGCSWGGLDSSVLSLQGICLNVPRITANFVSKFSSNGYSNGGSNGNVNGYQNGSSYGGATGSYGGGGASYGGGGGGFGGAGGDKMSNLGAGLKTQHWGELCKQAHLPACLY